MSVTHFNPNRSRSARSAGGVRLPVQIGDLGTWTNPNTKEQWPDLVVRYVYSATAALMIEGCFGKMGRSGDLVREQKSCMAADFRVTTRKSERA